MSVTVTITERYRNKNYYSSLRNPSSSFGGEAFVLPSLNTDMVSEGSVEDRLYVDTLQRSILQVLDNFTWSSPVANLLQFTGNLNVVGNSATNLFSVSNTNGAIIKVQGNPTAETGDISFGDIDGQGLGMAYSINFAGGVDTHSFQGNMKVAGNILATNEITAYSSSDIRLKENIKPLINGLELNRKFNPITFNWNYKAKELNGIKDDRINYGNIAQEISETNPELVHSIYGNYLALDYKQMIPIHTAAINELDSEVETLKKRVIEL